ncbi:hypothetical protein QCA50_006110 [Cerrena zonata]|uniref:Agglutinin n=1 Tax=Cerrena zonata TaxID=2478898 RepID=A0AAW0GGY0_9APHY
MSFVGLGIYHIRHANVANVRMALANSGSADIGTAVIAWRDDNDAYDHMWLVQPVPNEADTYTIRNLSTGTYADLSGSSPKNGTHVIGWSKNGANNQKWIIKKDGSDGSRWKSQNKATGTFMDLYGGGGSGTNIVGWEGSWTNGNGNQQWLFERLSVTASNVNDSLKISHVIRQDFKSYLEDGLYLIPTKEQLSSILQNSGLTKTKWRTDIFDCDDFATVLKAEVSKWGNVSFKADGFAVLCGMMFGSKDSAAHAYNWTLDRTDNLRIWFLEPQNGQYSEDAWGYKGYFGLF